MKKNSAPPPPPEIPETDFAERLGVSLEIVRSVRRSKLTETLHWRSEPERGWRILLTVSGADLLLQLLAARGDAEPEPEEPQTLVVVKQVSNPSQVLARRVEDDPAKPASIVLEVPSVMENGRRTNYFTPGLGVLAEPLNGARWRYVGPRPRGRGDACLKMYRPPAVPAPAPAGNAGKGEVPTV